MATTTNYSWTTPDDTALVKDGAAAIRTLGSSVDTTVKNLNPETTLGDIAYRSSTANVNTRLALGTAGQVLQVNSGATAPEWATPASGVPANATATVATFTATNSSTYTDMSTAGPAVTVTTGTKALVIVTARIRSDQASGFAWMSYAVSGATTVAASDTTALMNNGTSWMRASAASVVTLTAGSNTFTAKYKATTAGYIETYDKDIFVMNLA